MLDKAGMDGRVKVVANAGIATRAFLMGHPNQDKNVSAFFEVVGSTETFDTIRLALCTPLPRTRLWEYCRKDYFAKLGSDNIKPW